MKNINIFTIAMIVLVFCSGGMSYAASKIVGSEKIREFDGKRVNPMAGDFLWELQNLPEPMVDKDGKVIRQDQEEISSVDTEVPKEEKGN
jgi:hypothetical protein